MSNPFAQIKVGSSGGGKSSIDVWRGETTQDGELVYETQEFGDYTIPTRGEYRLKVTGLGEPFEDIIPEQYMTSRREKNPNASNVSMKTAVEFEFVGGKYGGQRVLINYLTLSLSDGGKSGRAANLYRIFAAACPEGGSDPGDMLGRELLAYMQPSDSKRDDGTPKYAVMSYDTCAPVEDGEAAEHPEPAVPASNPFQKKSA